MRVKVVSAAAALLSVFLLIIFFFYVAGFSHKKDTFPGAALKMVIL